MNKTELSNACVEMNEILKNAPIKFRLICPIKIKKYFIKNASRDYKWNYDTSKKLYEQNISNTTKGLLSYLYIKYVSNSKDIDKDKEIKQLSQYLNLNVQKESFDYDSLFKKTKDKQTEQIELITVKKQGNFFTRLLKKIISFLVPKNKEN